MTSRLAARLDRLRPLKIDGFVVHQNPGESDLDIERKALTAGRPVIIAPRPCNSAEEWLLTCGPIHGDHR